MTRFYLSILFITTSIFAKCEILQPFDGIYIDKSAYNKDKKELILYTNTRNLILYDLLKAKVTTQTSFENRKISSFDFTNSLIIGFDDGEIIFFDPFTQSTIKSLNLTTNFDSASFIHYAPSALFVLKSSGELVLINNGKIAHKNLNSSVLPSAFFVDEGGIFVAFFDGNLYKLSPELELLKIDKHGSFISAISSINGGVILGNSIGEVKFDNKTAVKVSNSQIDSIKACGKNICIGDWNGRLFVYDDSLKMEKFSKKLFDDRLRALFFDEKIGLIALSWNGKLAVCTKLNNL